MNLCINRKLKTPVYRQIAAQIKERILKGELLAGFPLPSERDLARLTGVHRNTVRKAYSELEDKELVEVRQGVGYMVTYGADGLAGADSSTGKTKAVRWSHMIKDEYLNLESTFDDLFSKSYETDMISFAAGMPAPEIYNEKDVGRNLAEILSRGNRSYFYTPYQGDYSLRQNISGFMRSKGLFVNPGEIQVLSETNQALDFIVTLLLSPGDKVIMEEVVSPDVYRAIELAGGLIVTAPMDENGLITDCLGPLIEKHKPKFIYVNSSYHDPTGRLLSRERRQMLVRLSYRYRIPIIEEDGCSELSFEGDRLPPVKAFDKGNNVIYIYSFALTFIAGISVAFVAAPKEIVKRLSYLVSIRLINLDWISQKLLDHCFEEGEYGRKLEDFRQTYQKKRDVMCRWLEGLGDLGVTFSKPSGGVYLWCRLPDSMDMKELLKEAEDMGISFIPGNVFFPEKNPRGNFIRLNYSQPTIEEIDKGMAILSELIWKKMKKTLAHEN